MAFLLVGLASLLELPLRALVVRVVRIHAHRAPDLLERHQRVARRVVGQRAEVVPAGRAAVAGHRVQDVHRLLTAPGVDGVDGVAHLYVVARGRLGMDGLAAAVTCAAKAEQVVEVEPEAARPAVRPLGPVTRTARALPLACSAACFCI